MKIDRRLNLVIPIEDEDGKLCFAHSTPISAETFDVYFREISKTFSQLYADGLGMLGGPRVADKMLREIAKEMGTWADDPAKKRIGVERGLMAEIRRLTNILAPGEKGWELTQLDLAVKDEIISPADAQEIEAAACFFTVCSASHRRATLKDLVDVPLQLLGAQSTYSSCTEFRSSLPTLTADENSGAAAAWWAKFSTGQQEPASATS